MKFSSLFFLGISFCFTVTAQAAFKMKPGLWEIQSSSGLMSKMSPERRAQMSKFMGDQGIRFGEKGIQVCHSEDASIEQSLVQRPTQNKCKITDRKELVDGIKFGIQCDNGSGTAEYHRVSDNIYKGWNEFQTDKGKHRVEFSGKFISANCGDVKPLATKE